MERHAPGAPLPPSDLRHQLQATLTGSYTIERELGGGGLAHVFVAVETALRRSVVINSVRGDDQSGEVKDA